MNGELLAAARHLLADVDSSRVLFDADLGPFCTYRVGGKAAVLVHAESVADLEAVAALVTETNARLLVVGKGSNLLVADAGFPGVAVRLGEAFESIDIGSSDRRDPVTGDLDTGDPVTGSGAADSQVECGAAALLPVAARRTAAAALTGFEWAVGVPGSIGGAVRMNAGGHGSDMAASVVSASIFDVDQGKAADWMPEQLGFGYRTSSVRSRHIVLSCRLQLEPGDAERSAAEISEIVRWRRANQPGGQNAGSVFANPEGDSAGRLIDSLGLKGFSLGSASVSDKHANFIQAEVDGSADDVYRLIVELRRRVADAYGIELRPENVLVGFEPVPPCNDGPAGQGVGPSTEAGS